MKVTCGLWCFQILPQSNLVLQPLRVQKSQIIVNQPLEACRVQASISFLDQSATSPPSSATVAEEWLLLWPSRITALQATEWLLLSPSDGSLL